MKTIPREVNETRPITWSREIRELQTRLLDLDYKQKEVLIGTLLGDGCLTPNAYGRNYRLEIGHSSEQKEYVEWKYQIFNRWCLSKPKFRKRTDSWRFRTISHPVFTGFRGLFYQGTKKILPKEIGEILTSPLSLAVWFMDDGTHGPRNGLTINTQNFTRVENETLAQLLKESFRLETSLHRDKVYWRIYIQPQSKQRFISLVEEFIIPELRYKLVS